MNVKAFYKKKNKYECMIVSSDEKYQSKRQKNKF